MDLQDDHLELVALCFFEKKVEACMLRSCPQLGKDFVYRAG